MSKKKIIIIAVASLTLVALLLWAVPVFAADSGAPSAQNLPQAGHVKVLLRLMLIQDEAKVDTLLDKAQQAEKLTVDQAGKIKDFWTQHHAQFTKNALLKRLLSAGNEARVQQFLDKAVQSGKIKQEQADRIIKFRDILHTNNP
jgi:hypothetical protein